jgi:hypothetical protein
MLGLLRFFEGGRRDGEGERGDREEMECGNMEFCRACGERWDEKRKEKR